MITERSNVPVWSAVYVLNMGKTVLCINVMTKGWIAFDGKIKLHYTANWKVRYRGEFEMTHRVWIGCFCWYCMMFVVGILATWLVGSLVFSPNVPEGFLLFVKIVLWVLCCEMTAFISHWLRSPLWIVIHNSYSPSSGNIEALPMEAPANFQTIWLMAHKLEVGFPIL